MAGTETIWLDVVPLVAAVDAAGGLGALGAGRSRDGVATLRANFYRARNAGRLTRFMADDLCVRLLQCHPSEVWGEQWSGSLDGVEPETVSAIA